MPWGSHVCLLLLVCTGMIIPMLVWTEMEIWGIPSAVIVPILTGLFLGLLAWNLRNMVNMAYGDAGAGTKAKFLGGLGVVLLLPVPGMVYAMCAWPEPVWLVVPLLSIGPCVATGLSFFVYWMVVRAAVGQLGCRGKYNSPPKPDQGKKFRGHP